MLLAETKACPKHNVIEIAQPVAVILVCCRTAVSAVSVAMPRQATSSWKPARFGWMAVGEPSCILRLWMLHKPFPVGRM